MCNGLSVIFFCSLENLWIITNTPWKGEPMMVCDVLCEVFGQVLLRDA